MDFHPRQVGTQEFLTPQNLMSPSFSHRFVRLLAPLSAMIGHIHDASWDGFGPSRGPLRLLRLLRLSRLVRLLREMPELLRLGYLGFSAGAASSSLGF